MEGARPLPGGLRRAEPSWMSGSRGCTPSLGVKGGRALLQGEQTHPLLLVKTWLGILGGQNGLNLGGILGGQNGPIDLS